MIEKIPDAEDTSDREIITRRLLNAPRELVFEVWTNPEHVVHWWGPDGFTNTIDEMDVRPGGTWKFMMHGPDGVDYPNQVVYLEVVRPERLVYTHGNGIEAARDFYVVVTFEDQDGKTQLTLRAVFATAAQREFVIREHRAVEGGQQTVRKCAEYLAQLSASSADPA